MSQDTQPNKIHDVVVDAQPEYLSHESRPEQNHYFFSYHITISNNGTLPARLLSRHWVITNGHGAVHEVKGKGVVGQQPLIQPGDSFEYSSACPLDTPMGMMQGTYDMVDSEGAAFQAVIEPFILNASTVFH